MAETEKLLNLKEVAKILDINLEVLRRWLRKKKLKGIKIGSDWRVKKSDLDEFINGTSDSKKEESKITRPGEPESPQKMCFRFPKWLEFSGLPKYLNTSFGPEAWPVFKKLVELDFELGKPEDRTVPLDFAEMSERVGYEEQLVKSLVKKLALENYIKLSRRKGKEFVEIVTPIRTPKLVLDINYQHGGIKGAPEKALENNCLRRFLEVKDMKI